MNYSSKFIYNWLKGVTGFRNFTVSILHYIAALTILKILSKINKRLVIKMFL